MALDSGRTRLEPFVTCKAQHAESRFLNEVATVTVATPVTFQGRR